MRFAYADPPYLGCGKRLYGKHHAEAAAWDDPETHRRLIERLSDEWPDGWALSLHAPSLRTLLPMCPADVRVAAACKNFAQIRPVRVQYMWEPVIWRGGRLDKVQQSPRDWLHYSTAPRSGAKDGIIGGKPRAFCRWVFSLLGAERGDVLDDLFPGTGAVTAAWQEWSGEHPQVELFGEVAA